MRLLDALTRRLQLFSLAILVGLALLRRLEATSPRIRQGLIVLFHLADQLHPLRHIIELHRTAQSAIAGDVFAIVPLFISLGFLVGAAGLGKDAPDLSERLFRKLPGGSGVGTVGATVGGLVTYTAISAVPLPAGGLLLFSGLIGTVALRRKTSAME